MDIYSILSSKPHNPHYLNRYITFVQQCQQKNASYEGYIEEHHICPKADDMFPEYTNFRSHPWNCAILTARQHFISHIILWKTFPGYVSCKKSLWFMSNGNWKSFNSYSKIYERLRIEIINELKQNSIFNFPINKNKVVVKNSKNEIFRVSIDDERYVSGELVGITKGSRVVVDKYGNKFMSSSPDFNSIHKDMIPIKTEDGKIHKVHRNSKEWASGKYQAQHKDTVTVKDKTGNAFRVKKDDPRYLSGEFVGIVKDTITVKDKDGNMFRVAKDDPRYISGEFVGSMRGKITINDGVKNRRINSNSEIPKGWSRGMVRKYKKLSK